MDLRGFGDSGVADDKPGSATAAADLHKLIEHLDVGPVHLTGQDLSGMATFRLAVAHPESIKSYTAMPGFAARFSPTRRGAVPGASALFSRPGSTRCSSPVASGSSSASTYWRRGPEVTAADVEEFVRTYSRPGGFPGAMGRDRSLVHDGANMKATAGRWSPDVAVMTIGTAAGERVHAGLSAATDGNIRSSVVLDDVSHYAALQAPDRVADALLAFFTSIDR